MPGNGLRKINANSRNLNVRWILFDSTMFYSSSLVDSVLVWSVFHALSTGSFIVHGLWCPQCTFIVIIDLNSLLLELPQNYHSWSIFWWCTRWLLCTLSTGTWFNDSVSEVVCDHLLVLEVMLVMMVCVIWWYLMIVVSVVNGCMWREVGEEWAKFARRLKNNGEWPWLNTWEWWRI